MSKKIGLILLCLSLVNITISQKLFRCFYYFDESFVSYNLKDLYLEDKSSHLDYPFTKSGVSGKILVNVCDAIEVPEQCNAETTSKFIPYKY